MVQVVFCFADIVFPVVVGLESCAALILDGGADVECGFTREFFAFHDGVDDLDCFHGHFVVVGLFFLRLVWCGFGHFVPWVKCS